MIVSADDRPCLWALLNLFAMLCLSLIEVAAPPATVEHIGTRLVRSLPTAVGTLLVQAHRGYQRGL